MKDFQWYRKLRGGMWVCLFTNWRKVRKENYHLALSLMDKGYRVEDHRYNKDIRP